MISSRVAGFGVLVGAGGFVAIVGALHFLQPSYDFRRQLMSELADGVGGWTMLPAFLLLAASTFFAERGLRWFGASFQIRVPLLLSAIAFVGAGVWTLRAAPLRHVTSIALAFIMLVSSMALLPRQRAVTPLVSRSASWALAVIAALSVAGADTLFSLAIAQRITAAGALTWLALIGWQLATKAPPVSASV